MLRFKHLRPGEVEGHVDKMTKVEFLKVFPRHPTIITNGINMILIPVPEDAVCCDACNDDPLDSIYVLNESYTYCEECFQKYLAADTAKESETIQVLEPKGVSSAETHLQN